MKQGRYYRTKAITKVLAWLAHNNWTLHIEKNYGDVKEPWSLSIEDMDREEIALRRGSSPQQAAERALDFLIEHRGDEAPVDTREGAT